MKQKEFYDSEHFKKSEELKEDEFFTTPQIFVNELLKLHQQKLLNDRMLDDQIFTMIVGVMFIPMFQKYKLTNFLSSRVMKPQHLHCHM